MNNNNKQCQQLKHTTTKTTSEKQIAYSIPFLVVMLPLWRLFFSIHLCTYASQSNALHVLLCKRIRFSFSSFSVIAVPMKTP